VGRQAQLGQLRAALRTTAAGRGGCIVVEGLPGIGKSALLTATCDMAEEFAMAVATGRATELDQLAPMSTLVLALQSNPALAPRIIELATDGKPLWLAHRVGDVIKSNARSCPLVIAIDDAHWADELTAFALQILAPTLTQAPVLLLLARGTALIRQPIQNTVDRLAAEGAVRLPVGPLDDDAILQMCTGLLGVRPDKSLLDVVARGGGNPFLVEELVRGLREAGQLNIRNGLAHLARSDLPALFLDAVGRRLRDLSPQAHRLLEAGAVLGRPFTVHEVARLAGTGAVELIPAAKEAVQAGALIGNESELSFRHDLVREAVYDAMPCPVRAALHREAATVVMDEGRPPLTVADHLLRGGHISSQRAIDVLIQAAESAAPSTPSKAADLLLRVLDVPGEHHQYRPCLTARTVRLLARVGRVVEARELGERGLRDGLSSPDTGALMLGLSEALKHADHNHAVIDTATAALARSDIPDAVRAQLLAVKAHALLRTGEFETVDAMAAQAAQLGKAARNNEAVVFATAARSRVALSGGHLAKGLAYAREAVAVADVHGGDALHWHPRLWLAQALIAGDRFTEADTVLATGQREAEQLGTGWSQPLWHYYRAQLRIAAGQLSEALAEAEAGARIAEQSNAPGHSVPLLALLGHIFLLRNDMTRARSYVNRAQKLARAEGSVGPELAWRVAMVEDSEGHPEGAPQALADVCALLPGRSQLLVDDPGAGVRLVRMARQAGQHEHARQVVAAAHMLADRNLGVSSLRAAAAHAAGVLDDDISALRDAVSVYRLSPRPLARAAALEDAALAEEASGRREQAIELLGEAADQYASAGACRDYARVRRELQRRGNRRKSRVAPNAKGEWAGLTECEHRVARLVAEGLTNRQVAVRLFISPHTVDSHLRRSFMKLGVNSRVELTRQILAHDAEFPAPPIT
jgi:DNA-binding CsgD family transcriptional regulator